MHPGWQGELVPCTLPGEEGLCTHYQLELRRRGQELIVGQDPFQSEREAQVALEFLRAKAAQLGGVANWAVRLLAAGIQPAELALLADSSWEVLVAQLDRLGAQQGQQAAAAAATVAGAAGEEGAGARAAAPNGGCQGRGGAAGKQGLALDN